MTTEGDDPTEFLLPPADVFTATVIPEPEVALTPEGYEAAKALVNIPDSVTPVVLAQLARDVAQDLMTLPKVLAKHSITQVQYEWISKYSAFFRHALAEASKVWQSANSTDERLKLQSAVALEEQLPKIASRMGSASEDLRDVVEAAKLLAGMAGVLGDKSGARPTGERFTISIDLGADASVVVGVGAAASIGAPANAPGTISGHATRVGNDKPLEQQSEGSGGPPTIRRVA